MSAETRLKCRESMCKGSMAALPGTYLLPGTHQLWQPQTKPPMGGSAWLERCQGQPAHAGSARTLPQGPCPSQGSLLPLATLQGKGSLASKEFLHPSPGGTCAESANTAIPKKLQNKTDALLESYVRFSSSVRNWAPSGCSRLRGSCTTLLSHRFISFFFFFLVESKNLSEEIITLK